jgi:hypothetical protein
VRPIAVLLHFALFFQLYLVCFCASTILRKQFTSSPLRITMADPFSIIGSAVGVVSLGLTVCQGLISYYGPWTAYDKEISCLAQKAEGLKTTLTILQEPVQNFESSGSSVAIEVQRRIISCGELLESLQSVVENCKKTSPSSDLKHRAQALKKRIMYPFRRDTVLWLVNTVEGLQANLNTALQVLQLYVTSKLTSNMKTSPDHILIGLQQLLKRSN